MLTFFQWISMKLEHLLYVPSELFSLEPTALWVTELPSAPLQRSIKTSVLYSRTLNYVNNICRGCTSLLTSTGKQSVTGHTVLLYIVSRQHHNLVKLHYEQYQIWQIKSNLPGKTHRHTFSMMTNPPRKPSFFHWFTTEAWLHFVVCSVFQM